MTYPSWVLLLCLLVVSAPCVSAAPPVVQPGISRPPKLQKASAEELGQCYAATARRSGSEGSIDVDLTIEPDGSVSQVKLPPGIEPWQEETAQCVIKLLRFDAALKDGIPTQSNAVVPLKFSLPDEPVLESPRIQASSPDEVGKCYSSYARRTGQEGRSFVNVTIEPDGSVGRIEMPPGIEPWQEATARCVLGVLKFRPGTIDGVPVASQATIPINFSLEGSAPVEYPKLLSTASEIEGANRTCYPPDSFTMATPQYHLTINRAGKASKIKVVETSGDEKLDEAGICVLKLLKFQPAMRGRERVESTSVLPVTLMPPK